MKQLLYLAIVIVLGVTAVKLFTARSASQTGGQNGWETLTPEEAKARMDADSDAIVLDVRTQEEFDQGHIPGAVCLPNEDIGGDAPLPFAQDAVLLVYCRSGRRSAQAAEKLAAMGYTQVADFGGILSWPYETTTE